ncbi:MAG: excisionase [Pseudolabrys sp.]|nr:excisionase [Pseudolabrys sp.]
MPSDQQNVTEDTPIRLAVAAKIAFPDGSIGASGLRREASKDHLTIERIAGKDFTTLRHIKEMRELCCVEAKERVLNFVRNDEIATASSPIRRPGASATATETLAPSLNRTLAIFRNIKFATMAQARPGLADR